AHRGRGVRGRRHRDRVPCPPRALTMRSPVAGFVAGLVFGIGLALGGMTDPSIVLAFLDITGAWNPQLMFVMAGGVAVTFVGYRMAARRPTPLWDDRFFAPSATRIDAPLIG